MNVEMKNNEQYEEEEIQVLEEQGTYELVLHNDDYHTFDFVIDVLMQNCEHTMEQAEQCAWIVHNNGKCQVKKGTYEKLKPIYTNINRKGLLIELKKND